MEKHTNSHGRPGFRARFSWGIDGSVLWLKDEGVECRSLTNDIENCLLEVAEQLPDGFKLSDYHIIYRDSEGGWDAIAITALGDVGADLRLLRDYNHRGMTYCARTIRFKFFPITQDNYDEAVSSIVSNRAYRHFKLPVPQSHNLN